MSTSVSRACLQWPNFFPLGPTFSILYHIFGIKPLTHETLGAHSNPNRIHSQIEWWLNSEMYNLLENKSRSKREAMLRWGNSDLCWQVWESRTLGSLSWGTSRNSIKYFQWPSEKHTLVLQAGRKEKELSGHMCEHSVFKNAYSQQRLLNQSLAYWSFIRILTVLEEEMQFQCI